MTTAIITRWVIRGTVVFLAAVAVAILYAAATVKSDSDDVLDPTDEAQMNALKKAWDGLEEDDAATRRERLMEDDRK